MGAFSNLVTVPWTVPAGQPGDSDVFSPGWIGLVPYQIATVPLAISVPGGMALSSGVLDYYPASNPSDVRVLNANTVGTSFAPLGTFDPTVLVNGDYVIRLRATTTGGVQQTSVVPLRVTSENKPGRFVATVTDLTVPLVGIPITLGRTYDSLERSRSGDFGFGWDLAIGGAKLQVNTLKDVSFTIGGRRMTFFLNPSRDRSPSRSCSPRGIRRKRECMGR